MSAFLVLRDSEGRPESTTHSSGNSALSCVGQKLNPDHLTMGSKIPAQWAAALARFYPAVPQFALVLFPFTTALVTA